MKFAEPVTKERLQRFARLREEINNQYERLARIKAQLQAPTSPRIDEMPKNRPMGDRIGLLLAKKEDLEKRVATMVALETSESLEIEKAIELLETPNERQILRLKYLDGETWQGVTEALFGQERDYYDSFDNYQRLTYYYHKRALFHIEVATA